MGGNKIIINYKRGHSEISFNLEESELNDDNLQKIARLLGYMDKPDNGRSIDRYSSEMAAFEQCVKDERYGKLACMTEEGPVILPKVLDILNGSRFTNGKQVDAFIVLAYIMKSENGSGTLTVKRVTRLMRKSGIDCTNLQNLTPLLSKKLKYISKPPGSQYFSMTAEGDEYARALIERSNMLIPPS